MITSRTIHLEKANTLAYFLSEEERQTVVSLKITGKIGRKDFTEVLDEMCELYGRYDDDDNFIPDYELTAALRHLDMGGATYVDGDEMPYFGYCTQLETCILPNGIKSTYEEAEDDTGLSESESLRTLILPEGLRKVGGFLACEKLSNVILPEGLEVIAERAFIGCKSISSINIPASVRQIDGTCFANCNIAAFDVDKDNPYFTIVDGVIYSKDLRTLVAFPPAFPDKEFVVPEKTQIIGIYAFYRSDVESVILPESLIKIDDWAFEYSTIQNIVLPNGIESIAENAFNGCEYLKINKRNV